MKKVIINEIEQEIKELRSLGVGYRQIAKKTGLKVDTIKKYCKRHKIAGYKGGMSDGRK
jgi:DNA invertase Pin-like site-specific DNA recombinase